MSVLRKISTGNDYYEGHFHSEQLCNFDVWPNLSQYAGLPRTFLMRDSRYASGTSNSGTGTAKFSHARTVPDLRHENHTQTLPNGSTHPCFLVTPKIFFYLRFSPSLWVSKKSTFNKMSWTLQTSFLQINKQHNCVFNIFFILVALSRKF